MADTSQDKEILRQEREKMMNQGKELAEFFTKEMGFNSGSTRFYMGEDCVGSPRFHFPSHADIPALLNKAISAGIIKDAKYDPSILWGNKSYHQEGIVFTNKDGKKDFMPCRPHENKAEEVVIKNIEDLANAIRAFNPSLPAENEKDSKDHRTLSIVAEWRDRLILPPGTKMDNGEIYVYNSANPIRISLELVGAHEINGSNTKFGTGEIAAKEIRGREALIDDPQSQNVKPDSAGVMIEDYGAQLFNFNRMKYANEYYFKNERGEVVTKDKDGNYDNTSVKNIPNKPIVEATLELNKIWVSAFDFVLGNNSNVSDLANVDRAFMGSGTQVFFDNAIKIVLECEPKTIMNVISQIFNDEINLERLDAVKIIACFLSNPQVSRALGMVGEMSPSSAIATVDKLANEHLKNKAQNMLGGSNNSSPNIDELEMEEEDELVMTMRPNNTTNNY